MKRKVIQIAGCSNLISMPKKWVDKYEIKKGDELEIQENNDKLTISANKDNQVIRAELDVTDLDPMILRYIVALYKKGVDEIKVTFKDPSAIEVIQKAIGKEAVGFEIIDHGANHCRIKHVSGEFEEFDPVMRRTFLLLISMADESLAAMKKADFTQMKNIAFLEEANNRFTTSCRRYLNRKGHKDYDQIGPLYYIVEDLENIADEYKYLLNYLFEQKDKSPIDKQVLEVYEAVNTMLRTFYEIFYKLDKDKIVQIGRIRKTYIKKAQDIMQKTDNKRDLVIIHHQFILLQKLFNLVGPLITLKV